MKNPRTIRLSLRKLLLSAVVAAPLATLPAPLWALPATTSANVTSSSASTAFTTTGNTLQIVTPDRTVLKWVNFGTATGGNTINDGEVIIYQLPSSAASVLNMVTGADSTTIAGDITSNGRVFIMNPNGIIIGTTATISTAGLVLSTSNETEFFYAATGELSNTSTPTGDVSVNTSGGTGTITVGSSGNVSIFAQDVALEGRIDAGTLRVNAANAGTVRLGDATTNSPAVVGTGTGLTVGVAGSKHGDLFVTTTGGAVDVNASANPVTVLGGDATITTANGNVGQTGAGVFAVGSDSGGNLTINAGTGTVDLNFLSSNTDAKTLNLTVTAAQTDVNLTEGHLAVTATTSGALTITSAATGDDVTLNASTINGNISVASSGHIKSGGNVTLSGAARTITLAVTDAGDDITYSGVGDLTFAAITPTATSDVTLTSTTGDVSLPAITADNLTVSAGDDITDTGALIIGTTASFEGDQVTLDTATNDFNRLILKNRGTSAITEANAVILESGTSATGNVTITSTGDITFGRAAGNVVNFAAELTLVTNGGSVLDATDNAFVEGDLTITAGAGAVTLDGSTLASAFTTKNRWGQINVNSAASVTVYEQTTLNLGPITTAGGLIAYSQTGIINTGRLNIATTTQVGAGTGAAPGPIALDFTSSTAGASNAMVGTISFLDDLELLVAGGSATVGNYLASSATIVNEVDTTVDLPANVYAEGLKGDLSIRTLGAATDIVNGANPLVLTGKLTLNSADDITANNAANRFGSLAVTAEGVVNVSATNSYTVDATLSSSTAGRTATFGSTAGTLNLGAISSNYTGLLTFNGNKGITDSADGIWVFGPVLFTTTENINVNNSGHSFGPVTLTTTGAKKSITLVESGTLNLTGVNAADGSVTLTSQQGGIIDVNAGDGGTGIIASSNSQAVTLTASNGAITLDAGNHDIDAIIGATANGNIRIDNDDSVILGNVVTMGTLTVDVTGGANDGVSQASGTMLNVFGQTTFRGVGTGAINIGNTGNRLGALVATTGTGNITLREDTTLNIKSAVTDGTLTVTSESGSIIDTTDSAVADIQGFTAGGAIGTATFTANNGSITLDLAGSEFSTVVLNTGGDASVLQSDGNITLGASVVAGTLSVTNTAAGGDILQSGTLNVTGDVSLVTSNGAVILGNTANQLGSVRFVVGEASTISEFTTFNLKSGSIATAAVIINTNGGFVTSGTGGSSFTNNLTINAIESIVPGAGSLLVTGTFTVFSNTLKDLSALSKSGNLAGKDPVNLGPGTYIPPAP